MATVLKSIKTLQNAEEHSLFSTITIDSKRSIKFQLQPPDLGEILREFSTIRNLFNSTQGTRMETLQRSQYVLGSP